MSALQTIRDNLVEPTDAAARYVLVYRGPRGGEWRGYERTAADTRVMLARIERHPLGRHVLRVEPSVW